MRLVIVALFGLSPLVPLIGMEFPFTPPSNFTLRPDFITLHHPVTTDQVAAQLYFDQGLTLSYAFNHDAAYWSFLKASEADPEMAMAYWGMALALGPNINMNPTEQAAKVAYRMVQKAKQLSANGPDDERDYIQALSLRYPATLEQNRKQAAEDYSQAMRKLSEKYPDDPDAAVLYAESLLDVRPWDQWSNQGEPYAGTLEAIQALENVLKRWPDHLGANHYYVHLIEASPFPERALASAERLKTLLPSSGHILHMPSHIYLLTGDYQQAVLSNEKAVAADRLYIQLYGLQGIYPVHYLSHNLYFLSRAYSMQGAFASALRAAKQLEALYLPYAQQMPELEYYAPTALFVLLRFQRWEDVLEVPEPLKEMAVTNALFHFARAMAFIKLGDLQNASMEKQLFLEKKSKIPAEERYGYNLASTILQIATSVLEGSHAEAEGQATEAISLLERAAKEQDAFHYNEPPDWFFPVREALGGLLLRTQRYEQAEKVFREDLRVHPRNGRSLFGLTLSLKAQARETDLYWVTRALDQAWMYSDTPLNIDRL